MHSNCQHSLLSSVKHLVRTICICFSIPDVWKKSANVPGLVRLLQALLKKPPVELNQKQTLSTVLALFNTLLFESSTEDLGFYVLNTVVRNMAHKDISTAAHIWTPLFTRLADQGKTEKFDNSLVIFMSLFLIKHGAGILMMSVNSNWKTVSAFGDFLNNFWVPRLELITGTIELKLVVVALTKLISECLVLDLTDSTAESWGKLLDGIITLLSRPEQEMVYEELDVPDIGETFVHLRNAGKKDEYPVEETKDPKKYLVTTVQTVATTIPENFQNLCERFLNPTNFTALLEWVKLFPRN